MDRGLGALIAELPELGSLDRRKIANLVGLAPIHRDTGTVRGHRMAIGGRVSVRAARYMPTPTTSATILRCKPFTSA